MIEQEKKQQIRQKVLFLVMLAVGCLGAGIFSVSRGMSAYQNKEKFVQVDTEEKFSRLPQYLLNDLALLKDSNKYVRCSAAEALGQLRAKEAIPQLMLWLKDSDSSDRYSATRALSKIYFKTHQNHNSDRASGVTVTRQNLDQELILLGSSSLASLVLLLLMLRYFQQFKGITFSSHLKCYFPDEIVAELAALRERLTKEKKLIWLIRFRLFYQIITLAWGIYIEMNIDNLTSPSRDRRIDK